MRQAAASASSATPVECSRSHGDLRPVSAAMAMKAASTRSPAIQIFGNGSLSSACSHIRASSSSARSSSKFRDGELGEPGLVRGTRSTLDDGPCLVGACGGEEEGDVPRHVQETHRQRDRVAAGVRESPSVPAREDVLERCLDARAEVEPPGEPLRHLAHRRERVTRPRAGVGDGVLDHRGANLRARGRLRRGPGRTRAPPRGWSCR